MRWERGSRRLSEQGRKTVRCGDGVRMECVGGGRWSEEARGVRVRRQGVEWVSGWVNGLRGAKGG
jgi:hypothetical protein